MIHAPTGAFISNSQA